mgnify:CR=1 FL=1
MSIGVLSAPTPGQRSVFPGHSPAFYLEDPFRPEWILSPSAVSLPSFSRTWSGR